MICPNILKNVKSYWEKLKCDIDIRTDNYINVTELKAQKQTHLGIDCSHMMKQSEWKGGKDQSGKEGKWV